MTVFASLRETLQSLQKDVSSAMHPDIVQRLVDPEAKVQIYLAAKAPGAHPGVLLKVPLACAPRQRLLPEGAGFVLDSVIVPEDSGKSAGLALFCTDRAYDEVFLVFAEDVVRRVLKAPSPEAATDLFLGRISLWERFFRAGAEKLLSPDAQAGLYAELLFLRGVLIPAVGAGDAVDAWKGPSRAAQDFVIGNVAIEVKSSRAKAAEHMTIASELQLDDRPFKALAVAFYLLSDGGASCESLNQLITAIEAQLDGNELALGRFRDRLLEVGWVSANRAAYDEARFFVRSTTHFRVTSGFPRIIGGAFPTGVGGLRYTVEISAAVPFRIDQEVVKSWLKN
jgi:hypothetical protein